VAAHPPRLTTEVAWLRLRNELASPCLRVAERQAFDFQSSLLVRRDGGVVPARDVPAKDSTEDVALTDALWRAATTQARRIVYALKQSHAEIYGRRLGVTELALITLGAIERQLRRLVISPVGGKAILLVRPPHATTFDTTVNDGKTLGLHDLSLRHPELTWCTRVIYSAGEEFP
jgi:hypothetical protein